MKAVVKTLLRRALMALGAIFVWVKALAGGKSGADPKDPRA
jgi:hypothetical protein